jgi:ABC-2 type transport system permease protein
MRAYAECIKNAFMNNMVYRFNNIVGIMNTVVTVFVYTSIWKAVYGSQTSIGGISYKMVITNFILGLGITNAFVMDESAVARQVRSGDIAHELLRPIDYMGYILSVNLGNTLFRLVMNFIPAAVVCACIIGILPPASLPDLAVSLISVSFGYLVMFYLSFIVALVSFWYFNIWSFATIKNVVIQILSGIIMPVWFMPDALVRILRFTPFDSIFFIPVSIYSGKLPPEAILLSLIKQILWIVVLYIIARIMWIRGIRKLVLQGG